MPTSHHILIPFIAATALVVSAPCLAKAKSPDRPQTPEQVEMALGFVDKLLTASSLAKHIEQTKFPPAIAYLNEAKRLNELAKQSLADNDLILATAKRDEAIRLAFEAGHLSQMSAKRKNKPKEDFEKRLRSIQALTSAHNTIAGNNNDYAAINKLDAATKGELKQAYSLAANGDYSGGLTALNDAYMKVRAAVYAIRGGQTLGELSNYADSDSPARNDYESKLRSINALLDAQQRIADEKAATVEKQKLKRTVTALLNTARDYASTDNYQQALMTANQAYTIIASSIEQLRGGETLVRTLHFETPEQEYHYELDRNDTYSMLIHRLVEENKTMIITPRVRQFMDQANALRALAEKQANSGDFTTAIKSLEQSTRNLIFAMRNAGFFIPG